MADTDREPRLHRHRARRRIHRTTRIDPHSPYSARRDPQTPASAGIRHAHIDEYDEQSRSEIEYIRGFIVLHYHVTHRLYSVAHAPNVLFAVNSLVQVISGQGADSGSHHPVADLMGDAGLADFRGGIRRPIERTVAQPPSHRAYVERHRRAH